MTESNCVYCATPRYEGTNCGCDDETINILRETIDDLLRISKAAVHAMNSYRYGNSTPDLAEAIEKEYEAIIAKTEELNG